MNFFDEISEIEPELIDLRRYFHRHAEQSWQEYNTQKKIIEVLKEEGIPWETPYKTAVVATIRGRQSANTILGIRADIDALPITEDSGESFSSENVGSMHACGHDTHTAILLSTARLLNRHRDELKLTVRLIFQPAEEFIEDSGALHLKDVPSVKECSRIIGLHIQSGLPLGTASIQDGPIMASADTFDFYIEGKGGHGAHPEQCIDPIAAGVELCQTISRIHARELNPLSPSVISITSFNAGTTSNVIPGSAHLSGTARAADPALRDRYEAILQRAADAAALATQTKIRLDYHYGCAVTVNDPAAAETGRKAAAAVFGAENVVQVPFSMGGEDFSKYTNEKAFLLLGGAAEDPDRRYPMHNPHVVFNEKALRLGVEYFLRYTELYTLELGL